jgi:hypothetical protein
METGESKPMNGSLYIRRNPTHTYTCTVNVTPQKGYPAPLDLSSDHYAPISVH